VFGLFQHNNNNIALFNMFANFILIFFEENFDLVHFHNHFCVHKQKQQQQSTKNEREKGGTLDKKKFLSKREFFKLPRIFKGPPKRT